MAKDKNILAAEAAQAAKLGDFDTVRRLVKEGADVNTQGPGSTLIHYAASKGRKDEVKWLKEHDADPKRGWGIETNIEDYIGNTNKEKVVAWLTNHGLDFDLATGRHLAFNSNTPFVQAAHNGYLAVVKYLHELDEQGVSSKIDYVIFQKWAACLDQASTTPARDFSGVCEYLGDHSLFTHQDNQ